MKQSSKKIIAIDGPAGSGKSTVAKIVAEKLGFLYIDTGAMYRALTLKALQNNINLKDEDKLVKLCQGSRIKLLPVNNHLRVYIDRKDVTGDIRLPYVSNNVYYVARCPGVRQIMVEMQRDLAGEFNVVMEGRDIGTVVFPHAGKKFYLDADFNERVLRRLKELKLDKNNKDLTFEKVAEDIKNRDKRDMLRIVAPLKKAADAVCIDTTNLNIEEVVDKIMIIVQCQKNKI
ncbi:MAG: (d)CMP kinase [Candidatus Omnitrophota bacterium]